MAHYLPKDVDKIVDIGSGAGFPGIVLGILGLPILALEPNHKKMAFLKLVTRELRLPNVDVLGVRWDKQNVRIIDRDYLSDTKKCVLTARGLAPLQELLSYMTLLGRHKMQGFFLKGLKVVDELTYARTKWHYNHLLHQISAESYLVQIWDVEINKSHG
jgi:16S rRNA (guanine527-N7)-methyltransferase